MKNFIKITSLFILMGWSSISLAQFVENKGQIFDDKGNFRNDVHFVAQFSGVNVFFTENGIVHHYSKVEPAEFDKILAGKIENPYTEEEWEKIMFEYANGTYKGDGFKAKGQQYRIDMTFPGAKFSSPIGKNEILQKNHYFLPQLSEGIKDVRLFEEIRYPEVYPGIDLIFYMNEGGLKYDFEVAPNADISQIKIVYKGHQGVEIDEKGNTVVNTLPGKIVEHAPVSFQKSDEVSTSFSLSGDTIMFDILDYDKSKPLTIDPSLDWSTFFYDGSTSGAFTYTRPVWDASGNMFYALDTYNKTNFPTINPGGTAYYSSTAGSTGLQLVIMKFNSSRQIVWATYYPASQTSRTNFCNQGITIDQNGAIYVTGQLSFPYASPTPSFALYNPGGGAYYETGVGNGRNFILKFANDGTRLWATMFHTTTSSSSGLNTTGLSIDNSNRLVASGQTYTPSSWAPIPLANPGGSHYYKSTAVESRVPTLHRFTTSLALDWSTYISQGTSGSYNANVNSSLALDQSDNIFLATDASTGGGTTYTIVNPGGGAYQDNAIASKGRKFSIFKFNSSGALYWSTLYGGVNSANSILWQDIRDLTVASNGDVFLAGRSNSTDVPTFNPGGGAYMKTTLSTGSTSVYDGVILQFSNNGVRKWATYCGGNGSSDGTDLWGIAKDASDNITVAGLSRTTNTFPVLNQAGSFYQASNSGSYATVLAQFSSTGVQNWGTYYGDGTWMSSGGFGGDNAGTYVLLGEIVSPNVIPLVDRGGGAYYQSAQEASASQTDFIAEFVSCVSETNTTSTATICESQTKPLTSSGSGGGTWSIVSGGGSISGTTYTPANVTAATSVTIRYTDGCGNTSDVSFTVNAESVAPTGITGTTTICSGGSTTLTVSGGSAGTGASAQWYTGSCGGTSVGSGSSITVSPTSNTTYYVRYEGTCNNTTCASTTVTVSSAPSTPGAITGNTPVCSGTAETYSISSVTGATSYTWSYSGGGTPSGTTASTSLTPTSSGTLSVTATNTCGTSAAATLAITVNSAPSTPGAITGNTPVCSGTAETYSISSVTGATSYTWSYSGGGTPSGTTTSTSLTPTSSGTLSVTATNSCGTSSSSTLAITVSTNSVAPTGITGTTTICNGSSTTLTLSGGTAGTGATAQWYSGSCGGTSVGSGSSITVSPTSNTTYYVRYEGTCNTTTCASTTVTVNAIPTAPTIGSNSPVCENSTINLTANTIAGATYAWSGPNGFTSSNEDPTISSATTTMAGTYNCTVTVSGCTSSASTTSVTIDAAPTVTVPGGGTVCEGSTITLSPTTGGTWSSSNTSVATITNGGIVTGVSAGSADMVFTSTTTGCSSTASSGTITVNALPTVTVPGGGTVCEGSTITLSPTTGGTWSSSNTSVATITNGGVVTGVSAGSADMVFTSTTTGCSSTASSGTVTVTALDDASFSYSSGTYCLTGTDPTPTVTGLSGGTFSIDNGGTISSTTGTINLVASGVNTYTVTYTTAGTCPNASTASVNITSAPTAGFSYTGSPYCEGSGTASVTFDPGASGGVFSSGAGLTINSSTGDVDLNTSTPGTYTVSNDIVASGGCAAASSTASITIIAQEDGSFDYNGSTSFCENETNPVANITGASGGTFSSTPAGITLNASTGEIDLSTSTMGTTYDVTYTTSGTCPGSTTVSVTLNASPTTPTVSTSATGNTICEGDNVDITASGSTGTGVTYSVFDAPTGGTNLGSTPLTVTPTTTTTYYVEAFNSNGCGNIGGRQSVTVTVNPTPSINAGLDETICPGDSITLTATGTGSLVWSTTETTSSIVVNPSTTTTYSVTLTDANSCTNSDSVVVTVVSNGGSLIAEDDNFSATSGESTVFDVLLNDIETGSMPSIVVNPTNGSAVVNADGTISYTSNNTYVGTETLTYEICDVTCTTICDTALVTIDVTTLDVIGVPGGFSPNGDNINDVFIIIGLDKYPNNQLSIFNRWGDLVYSSVPYSNNWDGRPSVGGVLMGDKVTTGTYFYILDLGDGSEPLRGSIEIKRD